MDLALEQISHLSLDSITSNIEGFCRTIFEASEISQNSIFLRELLGLESILPINQQDKSLKVQASGIDFLSAYTSQFISNSFEFFFNIFMMSVVSMQSIFNTPPVLIGGMRQVQVNFPKNYNPQMASPLLILIHDYGFNGPSAEQYFGIKQIAAENGLLYLSPNGVIDFNQKRYWKADACCDYLDVGQDDTSYLIGLIDQVAKVANLDRSRVYLLGHGNGGYMSYKLACEYSDYITAIAVLGGASQQQCRPRSPVNILHIHGTADNFTNFDGGFQATGKQYQSVSQTLSQWTTFNGCDENSFESSNTFNADQNVHGDETIPYRARCPSGGDVSFWLMQDSGRIPKITNAFTQRIVNNLLSFKNIPQAKNQQQY